MKNKMLRQYKKDYTAEDILRLYGHYTDIIKHSPYPHIWLPLKDIRIHEGNVTEHWINGDPFLSEHHENKVRLAQDILENGTYHPLYVFQTKPNVYAVKEGKHRVFALQIMADIDPSLLDKKFMCVLMSKAIYTRDEYRVEKLPKPVVCRIPMDVNGRNMLENHEGFQYFRERVEEKGVYFYDGMTAEFTAETSWEYIKCYQLMSGLIRDMIYLHKERTGETIQGFKGFNDMAYWEEWINS